MNKLRLEIKLTKIRKKEMRLSQEYFSNRNKTKLRSGIKFQTRKFE